MVESPIIPTEILQRSLKKKNIIFEEIVVFCSILIFISASTVIPVSISAAKTTIKTMKPVQ